MNLPARGCLRYESLALHRPDLVTLRVTRPTGGPPAVDDTVNAASGLPAVTGFDDRPVKQVLAAKDA